MGHTNSTANLSLPQFIGTDKPTWLGDVNGAFLAIDGYVGTNDAAVAAAASDASSAISQASAAVNTANTANTTAGNASTAANNAVGVANTANAIAGTVDAKVGLLADLNTTDRTSIVNAINEVAGKVDGTLAGTVTGNATATYSQLFDALFAQIDLSKVAHTSHIVQEYSGANTIFDVVRIDANSVSFSNSGVSAVTAGSLLASSSIYVTGAYGSAVSDISASAAPSGMVFNFYY